jgi:amino acid transporter
MFERSKRFDRGAPPPPPDANSGTVATQERDGAYADGTVPPAPPPAAGTGATSGGPAARPAADGGGAYAGTAAPAAEGRGGAYAGTAGPTAVDGPTTRRARLAEDAVVVDREARLRQRDEFGGINWGAGFFGWVVAIGIGVLLTAIVSAAGAAIGLTNTSASTARANAGTIGIVGGALLIAIAVIAYYAGGYVAGRMSRFDGARQGFGVWLIGLVVTLVVAAAGAVLGDQYNVFDKLNLPRIPVNASDLTTGGAIALAAIVIGSLLGAIVGGKVGQRYHRRVDRAAVADY